MNIDIREIKFLAERDKIAFKNHAIMRMNERKIFADDVKDALLNGEIIEIYEKDRPLPSCLIFGKTFKGKALHIVIAIDSKSSMLWVITVYEPNLELWEEGFKKRRAK